MHPLTIPGTYRDGTIELDQTPEGLAGETPVLVTFLTAEVAASSTDEGAEREVLRQRAFARMREGLPLGGSPYPRREELHERSAG